MRISVLFIKGKLKPIMNDWELPEPQKSLLRRCKYYAGILFPIGSKSWEDWVHYSYERCQQSGFSPAYLAERRAPNLLKNYRSSL